MRVGIGPWIDDVRDAAATDWRHGLLMGAYYAYVGGNVTLTSRASIGTQPFERDWDALVILDACRVDALRAVANEFDFLGEVGSVRSVGSTSGEWMAQTFDQAYRDKIERTAMVTANAHSETVLRERNMPPQYVAAPFARPAWDPVHPDALSHLDEVWSSAWDDDTGTVPPRAVTERAIHAGRMGGHDRLIAHYLQPHAPYVERSTPGDLQTVYANPLESLRAGELSKDDAWTAYLDTLRLVLEDVSLLLSNLDADRVVLTADHGEAFGELGFYEHPVCCPHPAVKRVPWVELTATDDGTYRPSRIGNDEDTEDVESQLEALGYM